MAALRLSLVLALLLARASPLLSSTPSATRTPTPSPTLLYSAPASPTPTPTPTPLVVATAELAAFSVTAVATTTVNVSGLGNAGSFNASALLCAAVAFASGSSGGSLRALSVGAVTVVSLAGGDGANVSATVALTFVRNVSALVVMRSDGTSSLPSDVNLWVGAAVPAALKEAIAAVRVEAGARLAALAAAVNVPEVFASGAAAPATITLDCTTGAASAVAALCSQEFQRPFAVPFTDIVAGRVGAAGVSAVAADAVAGAILTRAALVGAPRVVTVPASPKPTPVRSASAGADAFDIFALSPDMATIVGASVGIGVLLLVSAVVACKSGVCARRALPSFDDAKAIAAARRDVIVAVNPVHGHIPTLRLSRRPPRRAHEGHAVLGRGEGSHEGHAILGRGGDAHEHAHTVVATADEASLWDSEHTHAGDALGANGDESGLLPPTPLALTNDFHGSLDDSSAAPAAASQSAMPLTRAADARALTRLTAHLQQLSTRRLGGSARHDV